MGILLYSTGTLLSDIERHDLGWFIACLCTPLAGEDLAVRLPRYRPTSQLARETNGDLGDLLPRWRDRLGEPQADESLRVLARGIGRRLVRTGFTLVMPRLCGWTSDLDESAAAFGRYYPARAGQMKTAARVGGRQPPPADPSVLAMLIGDLGPWLAAEYVAVHGPKTPRRLRRSEIEYREPVGNLGEAEDPGEVGHAAEVRLTLRDLPVFMSIFQGEPAWALWRWEACW